MPAMSWGTACEARSALLSARSACGVAEKPGLGHPERLPVWAGEARTRLLKFPKQRLTAGEALLHGVREGHHDGAQHHIQNQPPRLELAAMQKGGGPCTEQSQHGSTQARVCKAAHARHPKFIAPCEKVLRRCAGHCYDPDGCERKLVADVSGYRARLELQQAWCVAPLRCAHSAA